MCSGRPSGAKTAAATVNIPTAQDLRRMANRYRFLAASCILSEMAEELEQAADEQQPMIIPTTFGRC